MLHEAKIEAKKQQLMLMLVMGTPTFQNPADRRTWDERAKKIYTQYINFLMGIEVSEADSQEADMLTFYEEVVKKSKPVIRKDENGKLSVVGAAEVFGA